PKRRVALRAGDQPARVQHELATDEALDAPASEQRLELLLDRPVEGRNRGHSCRNTPVTRPSIRTCSGYIGSSASFSGCGRARPPSSSARGFVGSRLSRPDRSRFARCAWTVEGEASPTASPISRTVGG